MRIKSEQIQQHNVEKEKIDKQSFSVLYDQLTYNGHDVDHIIEQIGLFQVAIPSWALGAGGTRFGRFPIGGEPDSLERKIEDVGLLHALNRSSKGISLHIPWDIPGDIEAIKQQAHEHEL
ncbi:MAG: hypothetical protein WD625_01345, partial [Balneolales bacterium]